MKNRNTELRLLQGGFVDHNGNLIGGGNLQNPRPTHGNHSARFPVNPGRLQKPGGNPIFPGTQMGASIEQIREFIQRQKRLKGFTFTEVVGTNEHPIVLSGTARIFLGLALFSAALEDKDVKLEINNDVVVQTVSGTFLGAEYTDDEYYWMPRPLSGTDSILLTSTATTTDRLQVVVYYI